MEQSDGLVCAFLHRSDGWTAVGWAEIRSWSPEQGLLWLHVNWQDETVQRYIREESRIDPIGADALLAQESRPRAAMVGENVLVNLRGVNLNPGADPEDMVSIRLWFEPNRIVSSRHRRILAINDIREQIAAGGGPRDKAEFLTGLATRLVERMSGVIENLDDLADVLEERLVDGDPGALRSELTNLRRDAIALRRYLAPQREALAALQTTPIAWLTNPSRARLREVNDQVIRYIEELDAIRERAAILQDETMSRMSDKMNRNMYVLTIVATIMLPLGFITGLLGINVDGIPGSENTPLAFVVVCGLLAGIALGGVWLLKRLGWL